MASLLAPVTSGLISGGAAAGAGAAAAPFTGGLSLLLPLLMSFGPALVSKLFGGQNQETELRNRVAALLDPANQAALKAKFYQNAISSPGFTSGQNAIATGANQSANAVAEKMGAHGISGSGTSDVLSSLGPSLVGTSQAQLYSAADASAQQQAQDYISNAIKALYGTYGGVDPTQQYTAAGWSNFAPYLTSWLSKNYPNLMPSMSTSVAGGTANATAPMPNATPGRTPTPASSPAPTGSLQSLYAPNSPALAGINPAAMSMIPGGAGPQDNTQQRPWLPPAVKVKGA